MRISLRWNARALKPTSFSKFLAERVRKRTRSQIEETMTDYFGSFRRSIKRSAPGRSRERPPRLAIVLAFRLLVIRRLRTRLWLPCDRVRWGS